MLVYGIMQIVKIVPAGPTWMTLQLLLVSVIPLGIAAGSAMFVAQLLSKGSILRNILFCCVQFPLIFVAWQQTYQLLVTSWR